MADRIRILVDVHERQSGVPEMLAALGAEIEIASLQGRRLRRRFGESRR